MVAGSSRGLGYGVARELAKEGAAVCIASRDRAALDRAAETLRAETGAPLLACVMDAGRANSILDWIARTVAEFGGVDFLVANAGGPPAGAFMDFDDSAWQSAFDQNLMGTVRMIRGVVPHMTQRRGGAIVTITSVTVKEPSDQLVLSNVMRSGVTSLVKTLSVQFAPAGIRINNLMPGRIDTDRVRQLDAARAAKTNTTPEVCRAAAEKSIPMGRYGTSGEFATAAAFLLSDAASYITGSSLAVDGGALRTVW